MQSMTNQNIFFTDKFTKINLSQKLLTYEWEITDKSTKKSKGESGKNLLVNGRLRDLRLEN